ncbi:methyl-accepting chemotaxis sensory transducer with Cache sensor [Modicisalibacter ilicicola DSM 19980]|uniref:Methyl-accepting chemotaxis sensory transducer with Cache sensor n=1 Tax=Modicisalibacter ilicicola DSM 19980 TaxID=1121942 RepID=A0A1M4Z9R8_9GAMM|nr:methyl-accepting chemotaxis protein [Halomonas ilicicola]SHF14688.1 methyl-accepting chemotaxis sensory transducer with Cache sensor [Halomonas ilicicola DSM 19980]
MSSPHRPRRILQPSLQGKMLLLALVPLLMVTLVLVSVAGYNRVQDNRATLADQRELLIEARKNAVKNIVETAKSSIASIAANAGPNDLEAKERAKAILRDIRFDNGNYIFAYDYQGTNLVLPLSQEREGTDMLDFQDKKGNYLVRGMIEAAKKGGGYYQYFWPHPSDGNVEPKYSYAAGIEKWGWMLGTGVYITDIDAAMKEIEAAAASDLQQSILTGILLGAAMFAGATAIAYWLVRRTVRPIRRTAAAMQDIAEGKGDLTRRLAVESRDEIGELATQFNAFVERMQETLKEVRVSTYSVNQAANDIAQGSEELASRTEQAAANLQETSASMEEITSTVNHSAESAQQANQLVQSTANVARQGETVMTQVERTMTDISTSADKIGEIITMIDAIAFQTNILALNASVEAARAGEHGRGFAVVAQEVRTLASRSSDASGEIRTLIDTSASHTKSGAALVRNAGQTMQEIVKSVARVTDVIGEISAGAKEQSSGIGQVNTAVMEMDSMTQQNAAMVQQSSTAAANMRQHAQRLNDLINSFVLGDDGIAHQKASTPDPKPQARPTTRAPVKRAVVEEVEEWEDF